LRSLKSECSEIIVAQLQTKVIYLFNFNVYQREKTMTAKAERVIESMLFLNPVDGFTTFCALLHHNAGGPHSARLAHELQADLRLERGEVRPRQEIYEEAASLVHR
jgi:hypothetical protein